jgi:hypothetical protein
MNADLRQRFNLGLALILLVAGVWALFLILPLDQLGLSSNMVQLQLKLRDMLSSLTPLMAVGALGALIGLAELTSTFEDYPREAIATQWGQYLIWLNSGTAILAFFIARFYTSPDTNIFFLILTAGLGFPAIIRTNFTFAKQFSGDGKENNLGVNFGWLYEQFQSLCKKQIDVELMTYRRKQVDRLLARYPTTQELYQTALYTIKARATYTKEEENAKLTELQQTIDPKVPPEVARMSIGLLILEIGGIAYVDLLVDVRRDNVTVTAPTRAAESTAAAASPAVAASAPAGGAPDSEAVVKKLVELPLEDLVALANSLLKATDDQAWVQKAAAPQSGISEVRQKAPIAYYLIAQVGVETILRALPNRGETPSS